MATSRALLYLAAALWAASFLLGPRGQDQTNESDLSASLIELPAGRWLLGLIGAVTLVGCLGAALCLVRGQFEEELKLEELAKHVRRPARALAIAALIARIVIVAMVGTFVLRAAIQHDPREGVGLDQALRQLLDQPAGPYWAGLTAIALITFGCYSLLEARYREVLHT